MLIKSDKKVCNKFNQEEICTTRKLIPAKWNLWLIVLYFNFKHSDAKEILDLLALNERLRLHSSLDLHSS